MCSARHSPVDRRRVKSHNPVSTTAVTADKIAGCQAYKEHRNSIVSGLFLRYRCSVGNRGTVQGQGEDAGAGILTSVGQNTPPPSPKSKKSKKKDGTGNGSRNGDGDGDDDSDDDDAPIQILVRVLLFVRFVMMETRRRK